MRILIAHEAAAGAGGVETYLARLMPALGARGHQLAFLHHNPRAAAGPTRLDLPGLPSASVADDGLAAAMSGMRAWRPDVCFSHNMRQLEIDAALTREWPTVKMMHGYFGTCVSGQKAHAFPSIQTCTRTLGAGCLALYLPRHCGQLRPVLMLEQYGWASRQRTLLAGYAHIVVASDHMAAEYRRQGVAADRLTAARLFPTALSDGGLRPVPPEPVIAFAGRMTALKGGDVLIRAVAAASQTLRRPVHLLMAGDGPDRPRWRALATQVGLSAEFPGWLTGGDLAALFRRTSVVAVPSLWPEPFGLVGLDAAVHGVPAVAFDVGGISQWLRDGVNGRLVRPAGDARALGASIASILESPGELQRLGDGAAAVARELSVDAHLDTLERVLDRAVQRGRTAA